MMKKLLSSVLLIFLILLDVVAFSPSYIPHPSLGFLRTSSIVRSTVAPGEEALALRQSLLESVQDLRQKQARDGQLAIDFGVKGGELNSTTRAPQKVDFYAISKDVGQAADRVIGICNDLAKFSPMEEPTKYLGDKKNGTLAPLNGPWKLLFSTAADATFSNSSSRGDAKAQNIVDGVKGRITNVIDFSNKADGSEPLLKQLQVVIQAKATSKTRVELTFKYAKALLTRFFFIPIRWTLYIPVPAAFITRCIVFVSRILRLGRGGAKSVPKAFFDVMYLDNDLRIHKTGEDNLFVQGRESWKEAQPLIQ